MHEMLLAQRIIDIVEQVMEENSAEKALVIHITAEKMSLLSPDSLRSCFATLTENKKLAGAALNIKFAPLVNHCQNCNQIFASEEMSFNCIYCGWENPTPLFGRSVKIEGIEVLIKMDLKKSLKLHSSHSGEGRNPERYN
ncbi:MAG: hydrogenase maturation nickel metallochaperone HypA [Deltaproteobacteria bacterium]|nr:hydrogenase maturation nickel metallochaperone HypA [Deltaproteobacteria bacterium]